MIKDILPRPPRGSFFFFSVGLILCWLIFTFGHFARRPRTAFVDKACIHQSDKEQKRLGILSLPGFLRSSDQLVMLWTTRYFTRLWCVFEIVSWLRTTGTRGLKFAPVSRAQLFITAHFAVLVFCLLFWS